MLLRARIFPLIAALALVAGPLAAACADCCLSPDGEATLAPAASCCGDCEPSVESSPERPSAALRAAVSVPLPAAASAAPTAGPVVPSVSSSTVTPLDGRPLAFSPPRALSPLRL
jgi:hypothetical protein